MRNIWGWHIYVIDSFNFFWKNSKFNFMFNIYCNSIHHVSCSHTLKFQNYHTQYPHLQTLLTIELINEYASFVDSINSHNDLMMILYIYTAIPKRTITKEKKSPYQHTRIPYPCLFPYQKRQLSFFVKFFVYSWKCLKD